VRGLTGTSINLHITWKPTDRSREYPAGYRAGRPRTEGGRAISADLPLKGKIAWITGASRGLGEALTRGLVEAGASVAITSRGEDDLRELAADLDGHDVLVQPGSVADPVAMAAAAAAVVDQLGGLDVLVNMAGICPTVRRSEELEDAEWQQVLDVNLSGTFYCCREAARYMLDAGGGSIINVSSAHGSTGVVRMAAYGASKGGVENLTRSLAIEWAPRGVRVNCLAPGYFETQLTAAYLASSAGDRVRRSIPMGRIGDRSELVGAALFLASDASSYMTGALLHVDGGWTAQ
jgi:NAD(P)-dependent dehydrogenase (short-subunit alcohol dehydrogenase family)